MWIDLVYYYGEFVGRDYDWSLLFSINPIIIPTIHGLTLDFSYGLKFLKTF